MLLDFITPFNHILCNNQTQTLFDKFGLYLLITCTNQSTTFITLIINFLLLLPTTINYLLITNIILIDRK